jgi:hypothetical protein
MTFAWRDYFALACRLRKSPEPALEEASLRTAVSRFYYAAFQHAMLRAQSQIGFRPSGRASDHSALREQLRRSRYRNVAVSLEQLCRWREDCDYEPISNDISDFRTMAESAELEAQKVLTF